MSESGGHAFEKPYRVRYHDCDRDLGLSVAAALRWFEELALWQSNALGVGFDYYERERATWILSRWAVSFGRAPEFGETVTAVTQPLRYRGFTADRRFEITAADGTPRVRALARWVFLDTERMRPKRTSPEIAAVYGMGEHPDRQMPWDGEFEPLGGGEPGPALEVRPGDIDYNGHLNNIRYVEWALAAAPRRDGRPARLLVDYRGEVRLGATVRIATVAGGDVVRQRIDEGDRAAALLETRW